MAGASKFASTTVSVVVCLFLCGVSGCGGGDSLPRSAVSGKVTLDGNQLQAGRIRFVPIQDTPGQITSIEIKDGEFSASDAYGPTVGTHRIEIESTDTGGLAMDDEDAFERMRSEGIRRVQVVKVPEWYSRTSRLQETVVADAPNEFVFMLSTKRKR